MEVHVTINIFMSYSRRELGFVDDLVGKLEGERYNVWLDYRSLVPGKPWAEQIFQGIKNADVVLLVVSKASMISENVGMEWKRVLEQNKRIILLIFEGVDLPAELEKFEWVDFRGSYENALKELDRQLQMAEQEEHPAPQTGFKVPFIVWVAFALSVIAAIMSIGALWTLFIPFFLITLPFRIFKRNFHYLYVEASLIMLPLTLYLTSQFIASDDASYITESLSMASIPVVLVLLFVLRSVGMQRWGKPEALRPYLTSRHMPEYPALKPVSFFIEHAPQDRVVAAEMAETFKAHGHLQAKESVSAGAVFTVVSAFKGDSELDCEKYVVYPVILQSNKKVSRQISRVQWLDFRLGVKKLDSVAKFLSEPEMLLRALGIRPMGDQIVLPAAILYLTYFITLLAVFCIGSWIPYVLQFLGFMVQYTDLDAPVIELGVSLLLFGVIAFMMVRQLINRKGPAASLIGLIFGMLLLGAIIYWQTWIEASAYDILTSENADFQNISTYYPTYFYLIGNLVMIVYLFINRTDLKRWLPARK
jgi:hypothetical protein